MIRRRLPPLFAVAIVVAVAIVCVALSRAQEPVVPPPAVEPATVALGQRLAHFRSEANGCYRTLFERRFDPFGRRPKTAEEQRERIRLWKERKLLACGQVRYLKAHPPALIRFIFPDHAEDEAVDVAWCEAARPQAGTLAQRWRKAVYAANRGSTARGLFQELDTWWASSSNFLRRPFNPYDPFANTRQALWLLEDASGNWHVHWHASAGCWA